MSSDPTLSYRSVGAAVAMATAGVVGLLALLGFAGPWAGAETATAPNDAPVEVSGQPLEAARTPAHDFLDEVVTTAGERWTTRAVVPAALPPHPLVCGQPDLAPVVSTSMAVDGYAQVFLAVYPAGQGGVELERQLAGVRGCGGGWSAAVDGPGVQAHDVFATWDGKRSTTRVWRHGDVLTYAVVDRVHAARLGDLTAALDGVVTGALDGKCVSPASVVADANRSPFHAPGGYVGYLLPERVAIAAAELPEAPEEATVQVGEETVTLDYATFPFVPEDIAEVERPQVPPYPVWPELPAEVEVPAAPEAPETPPVETTVEVAHDDPEGPGCGWAFTGQVAPPFDADKAKADRDVAVLHAQDELEDGVDGWKQAVTSYWQAWPAYLEQVAAYRTYSDEVAEVTAAWEVIAEQWRQYEEAHAQWREQAEERAERVAAREALETEWEAEVARCEAAAAEWETSEPDPAVGEEQPVQSVEDCAGLERPAELDEPLPPEPVEPTEPEDPRP